MEPRVDRAVRLMTVGLRSDFSIIRLSESVNLSPSRFSHLFKDETGVSPMRYLKAQRMRQAKLLLETTPLSIKAVMIYVGITDKSHFIKDFRKEFLLSPTKYREQHLRSQERVPMS
jgi:AraC family transcriptional regulator, arabinose operon regulatory protein